MYASALYLPVEIKKRELDGQILLAKAAAKLGFTVFIGSHAAISSLLEQKKERSGIYLDKSVPSFDSLTAIKSKCEAVCIMDAEISPILPLSLTKEMIKARTPEYSISLIDRYFVANNNAFEAAKEIFGDSHEKIINTGWPRFDVWRGEGERYYSLEISKLRRKFGNYLLFISSFGNLSDPLENLDKVARDNINPTLFWSLEAQISRYANYQHAIRIIQAWDGIEGVPPIIVRPHPSERLEVWRKDLGNLSKTNVFSKGDVYKWIAASCGVIHEGSTVSLQAHLMGKDTFFLREVAQLNFVELAENISSHTVAKNDPPILMKSGDWSCAVNIKSKTNVNPALFSRNFSSVTAIISELKKLTSNRPYEPYRFRWYKVNFLPRKIRRVMGLLRDEIYWKIGKLTISPQTHKIPWGIRRRDVLKFVAPDSDFRCFKVRRVTANLLELSFRND